MGGLEWNNKVQFCGVFTNLVQAYNLIDMNRFLEGFSKLNVQGWVCVWFSGCLQYLLSPFCNWKSISTALKVKFSRSKQLNWTFREYWSSIVLYLCCIPAYIINYFLFFCYRWVSSFYTLILMVGVSILKFSYSLRHTYYLY